MNSTELNGRTALVTGSTKRGIGAATAALLASRGGSVIVTGRDEDGGKQVVKEIVAAGGTARFVGADLTDLDSVRALAAEAWVDILVNNAGVFPGAPLVDQDVESFDAAFAVNVRALYFLTATVVPGMVARGRGSVVNVSTMAASVGIAGLSTYSATKAAVESLTRTWAVEPGGAGVRVNTVAPGPTRTEMVMTAMGEDGAVGVAGTTILGRLATTDEIASVIAFVASDAASYLTGATIAADAGRTAV